MQRKNDTLLQSAQELSQYDRVNRIAKEQGRAKLIGRPTMGNIDYLNPIKVRYENYEFTYPISKTDAVKNGNGVNDKGIEPDQYIPFKSLELMEETFLG